MAVSVDPPDKLQIFAEAVDGDLRFASDADGEVLDLLGVRHTEGGPGGADIAQSASFLIGSDGTIYWSKLAPNYRVRPKPDEILAAIDGVLPPRPSS